MNRIVLAGRSLIAALAAATALSTAFAETSHLPDRSEYRAPRAGAPLTVDGIANEDIWGSAAWRDLTHIWLGPEYSADDFHGRYKVVWTGSRIYVLVEFVDDILFDSHRDPLVQYWDDDCLEIFIDEDFSGGDHQYSHNAFTYHMSLDNQAIDIGTDEKPHSYSRHVQSLWRQDGNKVVWELAIDVYDDRYVDGSEENTPVVLMAGKVMGFMVAYCDNDGSELRENFIGSESVPHGPKDRGFADADLFGALVLVENN